MEVKEKRSQAKSPCSCRVVAPVLGTLLLGQKEDVQGIAKCSVQPRCFPASRQPIQLLLANLIFAGFFACVIGLPGCHSAITPASGSPPGSLIVGDAAFCSLFACGFGRIGGCIIHRLAKTIASGSPSGSSIIAGGSFGTSIGVAGCTF